MSVTVLHSPETPESCTRQDNDPFPARSSLFTEGSHFDMAGVTDDSALVAENVSWSK
jgi:hypothetical protein